ncbi:RHS repeat protein [Burkholderia sp. BCC0397]|uniref:RHS repeat domain-containing protein n=1 Tax=Burkholderia sp. BCC0397 TaxID=486876 RepID=UPI00158E12FD|nr:RHS repeat protein [Burkholderia sp. BCC0397]
MGDANNYEQYAWDASGNLIALRKCNGQVVVQSFDALNRLVSRTFPGGVGNVQYNYDLRGLKTASQFGDGSHTIINSYDGLGQLTQTSAGGKTLRYRYDAASNVIDVAWPDGFHVSTQYDGFGRPSQLLENGTASLAKYSYDAPNRRAGSPVHAQPVGRHYAIERDGSLRSFLKPSLMCARLRPASTP